MTWLRRWRARREPADLKGALLVFLGELAGFFGAQDPDAIAMQALDEFRGVRCDRLSAVQIVQRIQELSRPRSTPKCECGHSGGWHADLKDPRNEGRAITEGRAVFTHCHWPGHRNAAPCGCKSYRPVSS
jgi:hypothetical protein